MSKNLPLAQVNLSGEALQIDHILEGYKAYRIFEAALGLGLFDWLEKQGNADREQISRKLKINGMFIKAYLQSLVDLDLLSLEGDRYRNTPAASKLLVSKSDGFQGDFLAWPASEASGWKDLKATITASDPSGGTTNRADSSLVLNALLQRSLRGEMHELTEVISAWDGFGKAGLMLDIGSHGLCAVALCQRSATLKGVILDDHSFVKADKRMIISLGLKDRIRLEKPEALDTGLGETFDVICLSHVLYQHRDDIPCYLYGLAENLRPGGLLVSHHWFCSPGCTTPRGIPELEKCLDSGGHPLCHVEKFPERMEQAGLQFLRSVEVPGPYGTSMLHLAVKSTAKKATGRKKGKGCGCGCD